MLLFLAACSPPPGPPAPAPDPALARLAAAFAADPDGTTQTIAALPPAERLVALDAVTRANPGATAALCPLAPTPTAVRHCQDVNRRPHLWEGPTRTRPTPVGERAAPGPRRPAMPETPTLPASWEDGAPPDCAGAPVREACFEQAAVLAAGSGDGASATGACAALAEGRWRDECFFEAAEAAVSTLGASGYATAARICQRAGTFAPNCQEHLLFGLRGSFTDAERAIETVWADHERVRLYLVDHFWSDYAAGVLRESVPNPPAAPPAIATRHLRMELALVAVAGAAPDATLDALDAQVGAWEPSAWTQVFPALPTQTFVAALWSADAPGEDTIPATLVRARSRRAWSEDPAVDRRICLLEAAIVASPPRLGLLRDGLDEPDTLVRWTAARLVGVAAPNDPALLALATDPDPRIRARATGLLDPELVGALPAAHTR